MIRITSAIIVSFIGAQFTCSAETITFDNKSVDQSESTIVTIDESVQPEKKQPKSPIVIQKTPNPVKSIPTPKEPVYSVININGPQAPRLKFRKDIKKSKVVSNAETIKVVEFWATWCGPCRTTIPHLSKVQERYGKHNVSIVGVTREEESKVSSFVKKMGKKMEYRVALDSSGKVSTAYSSIWRIGTIPHAYVVGHNGKILWHGHPADRKLEMALREAIAFRNRSF
jgi:thiol-disulfide isomerase/thioredoxin